MTFIFLETDQIKTINYKLTLFYSSLNHLFMKYFNYKFLMVLLALAMAIPAARAQETLTVCEGDGETYDSSLPISSHGYYFQHNQMIYQAEDLANMNGKMITGITFYAKSGYADVLGAKFDVSLGNTTQSTFDDTNEIAGLTKVAENVEFAILTDYTLVIEFDEPFAYTGDNLVVDINVTTNISDYFTNSFWGATKAKTSLYHYAYSLSYWYSPQVKNFLPKATFRYEEPQPYMVVVSPKNIDFGKALPNMPVTQEVALKNVGTETITPSISGLATPFSTTYSPSPLAQGETATIPILFQTSTTGEYSGNLIIGDNGGNITAISIPLRGSCVDELTIYEGNAVNEKVPFYGYYNDTKNTTVQVIYPAEKLLPLDGKTITGLTFYTDGGNMFYNGTTNVTMGFTDVDKFSDGQITIEGTTVTTSYNPVADGTGEVHITFDPGLDYSAGKNLIIETKVVTGGKDVHTNFVGEEQDYKCAYNNKSYPSMLTFMPKVTFAYSSDETPVEKVDPEMAFEPNEVTVYVGSTEFTAPALTTTPADMTVTYSQEGDVDVALVDETTGEVLIGDKTGDVVIIANFAGDDNYNPGSASYTIHVVNKPELTVDEAVEFEATVGETKSKTFGVLGTDLQGDVTLTLNDETGYFTIDPVTITKAAAEELAEVTVTYTPMAEGIHEATVTVTSKDAEPKTVSLSAIAIIPTPAVAAPTFNVPEGEYTEAQNIVITCATEGANISYSTDGGSSWTSGHFVVLKEDTELMAKAEKDGETATATAIYFITLPEPAQVAPIDGYFRIKNLGNNKYANIAGRKTMNFTDAPADKAGTVIRVVTNENGQVQVLRSQGADLQRYADRAMTYIPEIVRLVVDKLNANEPGGLLGESGLDKILQKFNEEFDYHLYVEPAEGGYRIYGKTPSMQPVVDFYFENKAKVDEKLPQLQDFVNQAIDKILEKTENHGASILVDYSIAEVWQRMGGQLTQPVDEASTMKFYEEVLTNKDNVWNFAYQSAMIYWEKLKTNDTFLNYVNEMGDFAQYIDRVEQIRPDFKYYIAQLNDKPDFISQGNKDVNAARNIWALEENTAFTVNFPAENLNSGKYVTTLYTDFAYDLPEGVTAYKVTGYTNLGDANLEALSDTVPAQTPVILMAAEAGNQTLTVNMDNGTAPSGNLLVGPDYLITTYSIKTPMVENIFNMAKGLLGDEFYNNYLAQYEHLMLRNAGTVNNKYFWGLSKEDALQCMAENDPEKCVVRSLNVQDGRVAFYDNPTVSTNKAFLVSEEFNVIRLGLRGDVNRDGKTTIADVTALIDILLTDPVNPSALPQFDYIAADFNENGQIKINDVTALIDYLLSNDL